MTSDSSGVFKFVGLQYGTYGAQEITWPSGYMASDDINIGSYDLSYSDNAANLAASTYGDSTHLMPSALPERIVNKRNRLVIKKVDVDDTSVGVDGVTFALTPTSGSGSVMTAVTGDNNSSGPNSGLSGVNGGSSTGYACFEGISDGTYTLGETAVPDSYTKRDSTVTVTVSSGAITLTQPGTGWERASSTTSLTHSQGTPDPSDDVTVTGSFPTVQVSNAKKPTTVPLRVKKTGLASSTDTNRIALAGVEFTLYQDTDNDGSYTDEDAVAIGTTSGSGDGYSWIDFTGDNALERGKTYYVVETATVAGYQLPSNPSFAVTVSSSGAITVSNGSQSSTVNTENVSSSDATLIQYFTVANYRIAELPTAGSTGGMISLTFLGGTFAVFGGALFATGRRRPRRGAHSRR